MNRFGYVLMLLGSAAVLAAAAPLASMVSDLTSEPSALEALALYRVDSGDRYAADFEFDIAREEYGAAAELIRAQGRLPLEEVRRIGNAFYFETRFAEAARTFDRLAGEAAAFGDATAQAWAIADAAWMADLAGDANGVETRLERLAAVLGSGALSADAVRDIKARLAAELPVYAPHLHTWES